MDRRMSVKWVLAAAAAGVLSGAPPVRAAITMAQGYGTDPNLTKSYRPGDLWPLTLTRSERQTAAVLCDLIVPADAHSPSASAVGVVDFLDDWVSAPYPQQQADRQKLLEGFVWLDRESRRRGGTVFVRLPVSGQTSICNDICYLPAAKPRFKTPARLFARYRDLTADAFYATVQGRADLRYIGNVPRSSYEGPPVEVLKLLGLT